MEVLCFCCETLQGRLQRRISRNLKDSQNNDYNNNNSNFNSTLLFQWLIQSTKNKERVEIKMSEAAYAWTKHCTEEGEEEEEEEEK